MLVGDVDTGVDYGHGDFDDAAGNTRLVNIWDQTVNGAAPAGYGYGTEWSSAQIDANTCTETDLNGHGTHVLGTIGGDGSQTGYGFAPFTYAGMAPKADLIMVKTTSYTTAILDGVQYIFQRATALGRNCVVNLSLGSQYGPHDGSSAFESGLNALCGPGRIVVIARPPSPSQGPGAARRSSRTPLRTRSAARCPRRCRRPPGSCRCRRGTPSCGS